MNSYAKEEKWNKQLLGASIATLMQMYVSLESN
jgi:hypothetical protein